MNTRHPQRKLSTSISRPRSSSRQKLALVRALLHDPPVLLLDEPTSAMDPESARVVRDSICSLRSSERAIILCTHNLVEAETLADKVAIIRLGRIILLGSVPELKRKLLGTPEYEVHFARPLPLTHPLNLPAVPVLAPSSSLPGPAAYFQLDGEDIEIPTGVTLTDQGEDWLQFRTAFPETANPTLLRLLLEHNLPVVSLHEVPHSLEQIYLIAIHQAELEESHVG